MVDEHDLDFLLKYPLISCTLHDGVKCYQGLLTIKNRDYELDIIDETTNENVNFNLKTHFNDEINEKIAKITTNNIVDYLDKIAVILNTGLIENSPKNRVSFYRRVLNEYVEFVKFHLNIKTSNISEDLSTIHATTVDESGREHVLEIAVDFNETKNIYKLLNPNLPKQYSEEFSKNSSNLTQLYDKFLSTIEFLQPFFDVIGDLDRNCCVLDPEKPNWKECHRRIWLDQNLSVMVVIDPSNVRMRPDLKFLGPERLILEYRDKLNKKLDDWDENTGVLEGLLNILEMERFPFKPQANQEMLMDVGECSICFSLRFNNKLPEVICSNKSCENFYHVDCLYEWLTSLNSKRIFNQIQGQCPNCEKGISCPLPDVNDVT